MFLFLLSLIIILPTFNRFLVVLCLEVDVALKMQGEVFSTTQGTEAFEELIGVESNLFNAWFRGMASRKPLLL